MNNSVFSQNRDALYNLVSASSYVGIVLSENQTVDSMAAALSLYLSLEAAGKNPQVVSKKDPIVELSHLVGVDRVKKSFDGETKTVILSIPYREGEVEKVSFTTENGRMNFNIMGGEHGISPFDVNDVQILRSGSAPHLIFTIGVARSEDLASIVDITPDVKMVNIDTNPTNAHFGDVVLVDPTFSSLSEIALRVIEDLALPLDIDIAQNLMDGVSFATKDFSSLTTSPFAFEAASILLRQGARRKTDAHFNTPQTGQKIQFQPLSQEPINTFNRRRQPQAFPSQEEEAHDSPQTIAEDDVPSDWFVPKVFKGSKKQD